MAAVEASSITYQYGQAAGRPALADVSFRVRRGETYGILGPNGAGKTTLLKIIGTLLVPWSGTIEVLGHALPGAEAPARSRVGIAIGEFERTFHFRLSARENLRYFAAFYPDLEAQRRDERVDEVLGLVGLQDEAGTRYALLSQGMKHRLALARALLHEPDLLLLDEPAANVDQATSNALFSVLTELKDEDVSTVLATHDLRAAGEFCDRVLILREGKVLAEEQPRELSRLAADVTSVRMRLRPAPDPTLSSSLGTLRGVQAVYPGEAGSLRVHLDAGSGVLLPLVQRVRKSGYEIETLHQDGPSLEDVFLNLMGGNDR